MSILDAMDVATARPISLRARLGLVALVFLTLVFVGVGASTLMLRSWDHTVDRRVDVRRTSNEVAELRLSFTDQETGIRGYQLSQDPLFLEPYRDGDAVSRSLLARLDRGDVDIDGFDEQLLAVTEAAEAWHENIADPIIEGVGEAPPDELAKIRFDALRSELDELDDLVATEMAMLDDATQRMRRNVFVVLVASALAAIAGAALAAMLFRRWVIQPLQRVSVAARALAVDDTYPLPRFDSPELQDVTDAVGALQRSLSTARDDAVAAMVGLEQSAVLALQVRNELADEIGSMPPGWTGESMLIPAEGVVAGDCFDVGLFDADHIYVVVIDVTGHGASAALAALKAKSQVRAAIRSRLEPGPAVQWLSREMLKDDHGDLLTLMVMIVELDTGVVRYANAGHPTAKLTDGQTVEELEPTGPLVGAFDAEWPTAWTVVPSGWTLLVHTDGLADTIGAERERFGVERLLRCLDHPEPTTMLARIREDIDEFRVGPRTDDITAIALHRLRTEEVGDDTVASAPGRGDRLADQGGTVQP